MPYQNITTPYPWSMLPTLGIIDLYSYIYIYIYIYICKIKVNLKVLATKRLLHNPLELQNWSLTTGCSIVSYTGHSFGVWLYLSSGNAVSVCLHLNFSFKKCQASGSALFNPTLYFTKNLIICVCVCVCGCVCVCIYIYIYIYMCVCVRVV